MAIIRDSECGGIMMIPLLCDWGVHRCNIEHCRERPTTIITGEDAQGAGIFGLCEIHWNELKEPGPHKIVLDFTPIKEEDFAGEEGKR